MGIGVRPSSSLLRVSLIALIIACSAMRGATEAYAQTLVTELADSTGNTGSFSSLVLDSAGNPHVTYQSAINLRYARKAAGVWTDETAASGGYYSSLALDGSANPHVAHHESSNDDLLYTRKSSGAWITETADASPNVVGNYSSLVLDASANPHIAYHDLTSLDLKYARKSGGVWTIETVDGFLVEMGAHCSLALDAVGNPHVSYLDGTNENLKYARKSGGVWTRETADGSAGAVGYYTSIELDASANPHVVYQDATMGDFKYARKSGGIWTRETVHRSSNNVGRFASLELDAAGNPHATYSDGTAGNLNYARKSGGVWKIETLDDDGGVSSYTSLALDAAGRPHVAYKLDDLRYTYFPSVLIDAPQPGVTWPVGSEQTIRWSFTGGLPLDNSDVYLSLDGGNSFVQIRNETRDPEMTLRVPHTPTRFASIKIIRPSPYTEAYMDSFFAIDATIALAKFDAMRSEDGTRLTWETRPGPEADVHYRVERSVGGAFSTVADALDRGEFVDPSRATASRYRLIAINGLGEEYVLGETGVANTLAVGRDLLVQPNPARDGSATFTFRAPLDPVVGDAAATRVDVAMFDLSGRRIVTLAEGQRTSGVHTTRWDGRDDAGRDVAAGVYFARLSWNGVPRATERVTIVR